jgi:hypothetical protein
MVCRIPGQRGEAQRNGDDKSHPERRARGDGNIVSHPRTRAGGDGDNMSHPRTTGVGRNSVVSADSRTWTATHQKCSPQEHFKDLALVACTIDRAHTNRGEAHLVWGDRWAGNDRCIFGNTKQTREGGREGRMARGIGRCDFENFETKVNRGNVCKR